MLVPASFFTYIFLMAYTPGPNNIMSMSNASELGFKKSFPFNLGVLCGTMVVMTICALLGGVLYKVLPQIKPVMTVAGACYMLWLAWSLFKPAKKKETKRALGQGFLAGMLLQFINVKIIIYGITAVSSYILPYYNSTAVLLGFAALLSLVGFSSTICWSLFGAGLSRAFKQHGRVINIVMAILLCYCAVSLFF